MSLTRDQWIEMWESMKRIQHDLNYMPLSIRTLKIQTEINKIKEQIQSVIGQME